MINKSILTTALMNKFNFLTLHSIVNECFINGLPISQNSIDTSEKKALTKYSYKVLSQLGGFSALENAILNESLSKEQRLYLGDIYEICTEAAKTAAKRIANETDCKDPSTKFKLDEVVDKASFTDAEYKSFVSKAEKLDLDAVSSIIKDKTLTVIKDEQEQYEKEENLDSELRDALAESQNFSETSTEAYMDLVLDKGDPRHHVTVFSKLQDAAMEMMSTMKVGDNGTDAMPVIDRVTFEAFLDDLTINKADIDKCHEAYSQICNEEVCDIKTEDKPKMAMLVSIIVYTVMETLKTMNIYCPSQDSIKKFVTATPNSNKVDNMSITNVMTKAQEMIDDLNIKDLTKLDSSPLSAALAELKKISELLQISVDNGMSDDSLGDRRIEVINELGNVIHKIQSVLNNRLESTKNASESSLGYYDDFNVKHDIAQFNKISNLFSKNPNISEIRLNVQPDKIASIIDVTCANESGQVIKSSFMNMQAAIESSQYINYIEEIFGKSKLADSDKRVCIVINNGRGQKISLK